MPRSKDIEVVALDLEGTLISDAFSQIARPGLRDFLEFCLRTFPRVVAYTFVEEDRFRQIARSLIEEGSAPQGFDELEYVHWDREIKDLRRIPGADPARTVIVDDYAPYIHPDQRRQWIPVRPFDATGGQDDRELARITGILADLSAGRGAPVPDPPDQSSAIPFRKGERGLEVLLVTSIRRGKWILPKGYLDPGDTPARAAEREAREEAGVSGPASPIPVGEYEYRRGSNRLRVQVFPLRVRRVHERWPESRHRRRRWVGVDEALALIEDAPIREILRRFAAGGGEGR